MKIDDIQSVTKSVTKKWTAQRKKEERESQARYNRSEYVRKYRMALTDAACRVIPGAYAKVSDNGRLPAHARQIFYAARPEMERLTGKTLKSTYFTQNLLPRYLNQHPETRDWRVVYDARGHLTEPHTKETVPLGTIEVDNYLRGIKRHLVGNPADTTLETTYPTKGPGHRCSGILFIEKEGFHPLFKEVKLAERYDLAIMSTKGQSVVAARKLVDHLCSVSSGVPVLILHDFDSYGLTIRETLVEASAAACELERVRYEFENEINFIDLGLRLSDIEAWGLPSERVACKTLPDSLYGDGTTEAEREFLESNQRVELNAFTSSDFISWIESKLEEHGIKKVIPDDDTLEAAYRRAYRINEMNRRMDAIADETRELAEAAELPDGLRSMIEDALRNDSSRSWDGVLADIAEREADNDQTKNKHA